MYFNLSQILRFSRISTSLLCPCYSFHIANYKYNIIFFDRYASPFLLLCSLVYLINQLSKETIASLRREGFEEAAAQLVHDIQSPIAALKTGARLATIAPKEASEIIISGVNRVTDICNSLKTFSQEHQTPKMHKLKPLLEKIMREKKLQYSVNAEITFELTFEINSEESYAIIQPVDFGRIISNLVNNSVESLQGAGKVSVRIKNNQKIVTIEVKDNGKGIPNSIMKQIGTRRFSVDKTGGSSLGLYHAKNTIQAWGGKIKIESKTEQGTKVKIELSNPNNSNFPE